MSQLFRGPMVPFDALVRCVQTDALARIPIGMCLSPVQIFATKIQSEDILN